MFAGLKASGAVEPAWRGIKKVPVTQRNIVGHPWEI